jgi:hypothetical protein
MKASTTVGVLLVAIGLIIVIFKGISYTTEEEKLELGPITASVQEEKTIPLPTILGVGITAAGVLVLVLGRRRSHS